jgi:cytochrome P450
MRMTTVSIPAIDLYSAVSYLHGHPHEQYRWLRANAPVYRHPAPNGGTFWAVTRHSDIRTVERSPELFSSVPAVTIEEQLNLTNFLSMDDPEHAVLRRIVAPRLLPRAVRDRMPSLEAISSDVVDQICGKGECDLVDDVAGPMAGYVAADLLGISRAQGRRLHDLFMVLHSSPDIQGLERMKAAVGEALSMGQEVFREKRSNPTGDVFSIYANAEVNGHLTTEEEFLGTFILLTDGSLDTSRNLISGGMMLLLTHPEQKARLLADLDGAMPAAIEEMLRWLSPVTYIRRVAKQDTELAGCRIEAGDRVAVYFGSGNRDERVFVAPDTFDIGRTPNDHLAFGAGGPHFCVGSHLGRAEGSVMIRELLTRLPDLELASEGAWAATSLTSGLASLTVRFTPTVRRARRTQEQGPGTPVVSEGNSE